MLRTLLTARQAMHLEQTRIDTLANNLANVATAGFRQVLNTVSERLPASGRPAQDSGLAGNPLSRRTGKTLSMSHAIDLRPGPLQSTGRGTDVALSGRGFFVVQDDEGNELFTRDGSFRLDETGQLVTPGGLAIQGTGGPINAAGGKITVDTDGTITVGGTNRGRLRLVTFDQAQNLEHRGDGLLRASESLSPTDIEPGATTVMQGYLEGSNVDPVRTLVDMIAAQRAFEVESKVLQANDEMLGKSVNTLGRTT